LRAWAGVIASMLAFSTSWWDIVKEIARMKTPAAVYIWPDLVCIPDLAGNWHVTFMAKINLPSDRPFPK